MSYTRGAVTVPYPQFSTVEEAQAWAVQAYAMLVDWREELDKFMQQHAKAQGAALTAANGGTVNSGDGTTDDVIEANRTRIAEIEAILEDNGLLP